MGGRTKQPENARVSNHCKRVDDHPLQKRLLKAFDRGFLPWVKRRRPAWLARTELRRKPRRRSLHVQILGVGQEAAVEVVPWYAFTSVTRQDSDRKYTNAIFLPNRTTDKSGLGTSLFVGARPKNKSLSALGDSFVHANQNPRAAEWGPRPPSHPGPPLPKRSRCS